MKKPFSFKQHLSFLLVLILICSIFCGCNRKSAEAEKADELIMAIGEVTLDSESNILVAKTYYDTLTDAQKSQVENYSILEFAINTVESLKKENERFNSFVSLLEMSFVGYTYTKIEGDQTDLKISLAADGMSSFSKLKERGFDENLSYWVSTKQLALDSYENIKNLASSYTYDGIKITISYLNEITHEPVLVLQDGIITYDYMAE